MRPTVSLTLEYRVVLMEGAYAARWINTNGTVTVTDLGILPNANEIGGAPRTNCPQ